MTYFRFEIQELPDFNESDILNRLRSAMGAGVIPPITDLIINVITLDDILSTIGHEVDITEVDFSSDGTFLFQGRRVILHIRDVAKYGDQITLPKYHLANCQTLQGMWRMKRSERYVVSTRNDGVYRLKVSDDGGTSWVDREESLDVCKNCLRVLNWDNYDRSNAVIKKSIFDKFQLPDFFDRYKSSTVTYTPLHTDVTAPVNGYSKDFDVISKRYRDSVDWKCEACSADLSRTNLRRFLHVHHCDGSKNNNSISNLKALCIECHINEDLHGHLGNSPDLFEYRNLQGSINRGFRVL